MKTLLNTPEICDYLRISRSQFYRLVRENPSFPVWRVGGRWKADPEDLECWVKSSNPAVGNNRLSKKASSAKRKTAPPPGGWCLNIPLERR